MLIAPVSVGDSLCLAPVLYVLILFQNEDNFPVDRYCWEFMFLKNTITFLFQPKMGSSPLFIPVFFHQPMDAANFARPSRKPRQATRRAQGFWLAFLGVERPLSTVVAEYII